MIIDTHTHIFNEKRYKTYFEKACGKVGIVLSIHCSDTFDEQGTHRSDFKLEELFRFADGKSNIKVVGSVDIEGDIFNQLEVLEGFFREGRIFGIKLYPGYQHFYPSEKKVFPVAELCQKYSRPLIFHSGDVYDTQGSAVLEYSHPIYIDGLAVRYPKCKIVIAHFGFPYHEVAANVVSKNENVYTEISGTIDKTDSDEEAENLFDQYVNDLERVFSYFPEVKKKTMFGTDYAGEDTSLNQVVPYMRLVEKVFKHNERRLVFEDLAKRLFFS